MRMPKDWTNGLSKKVTAKSTKLHARIDMSEETVGKGLCPECGQPMKPVIANGIKCLCCFADRIVLPQKKE